MAPSFRSKPYNHCVVILHSFHEVHSKNAFVWTCLPVRPSVRMIHLENHWVDYDEIWYVCCAIRCYPTILLSKILRTLMIKLQMWKVVRGTTMGWVRCCTMVAKVETIEVRRRLFTIFTMVTNVWLGFFI
jgi:hypothetical protein